MSYNLKLDKTASAEQCHNETNEKQISIFCKINWKQWFTSQVLSIFFFLDSLTSETIATYVDSTLSLSDEKAAEILLCVLEGLRSKNNQKLREVANYAVAYKNG